MEQFQHFGDTMSRYFNKILDSVCRMSVDLIKPFDPDFTTTSKEISEDSRYMPYFKVIHKTNLTYYFSFRHLTTT